MDDKEYGFSIVTPIIDLSTIKPKGWFRGMTWWWSEEDITTPDEKTPDSTT